MRASLDFWSPSLAEFPVLGVCWKNIAGSQVTQLCVFVFDVTRETRGKNTKIKFPQKSKLTSKKCVCTEKGGPRKPGSNNLRSVLLTAPRPAPAQMHMQTLTHRKRRSKLAFSQWNGPPLCLRPGEGPPREATLSQGRENHTALAEPQVAEWIQQNHPLQGDTGLHYLVVINRSGGGAISNYTSGLRAQERRRL